jgi:protein CpxP
MKKSILTTLGIVAISGALAAVNPAAARGPHEGGGLFAPSFTMARMARHLDLNDEQRTQVRTILDSTRPEADRFAESMLENREAMKQLQQTGASDEPRVREIAEQRGALIADMTVLKARVHSQIHALLTPEQRERMQEMRARHRRSRHGS